MVKIYTKKGDEGKTSLRQGGRVSKTDKRIEAVGTIDELNCALAVAVVEGKDEETNSLLYKLQNDLLHIGALFSGEEKERKERLQYLEKRTADLEKEIDDIEDKLPEQKAFYYPGGSKKAALLDKARSVCRRAERRAAACSGVEGEVLKYLNRLSDYLYILARRANLQAGLSEREWKSQVCYN